MEYKFLNTNIEESVFDDVANHPLQSFAWGKAKQEIGNDVLRVLGFEEGKLKKVFTITLHKIPKTKYKIGYCPRSLFPDRNLLNFLKENSSKYNLIFIKFEPDVYKKDIKTNELSNLLQISATPLFPKWTQILRIDNTEEELLKNMKSKNRYNIRYALRKGVEVLEKSNDEGFEIFSKLYFDTVKRQSYHGHDKKYHQIVWDNMKKNIAKIIIAYYKNAPLAAYELFLFKDKLYYPYGGSSEKHRNLMASNLIMWEAIKLGKKYNAKYFDMWGSLPQDYDRSAPWSGFTRFKEGYGTEFVEFVGSLDFVINPIIYKVYNKVHTLRKFLLEKNLL